MVANYPLGTALQGGQIIFAGMLINIGIANETIKVGDLIVTDRTTRRVKRYDPATGYPENADIYAAIFDADQHAPVMVYAETPRLNSVYAPPKPEPTPVDVEALQREFREQCKGLIPEDARVWVSCDGQLVNIAPFNDGHEVYRYRKGTEWAWSWDDNEPPTVYGVTAIAQFAARVMECANLIQKLNEAEV